MTDCPFSADRLREVYWSENKTAADIAAMVNVWAEEDGEQPVTPETVEAWLTERDISLKSARDLAPLPAWDVLQARLGRRHPAALRRGRVRSPREPRPPRDPNALRVDAIDLTGRRFGSFTVQGFSHRNAARALMWRCVCDCGQERTVAGHQLRYGAYKSCGCRSYAKAYLKGRRFGLLSVLRAEGGGKRGRRWLCLCDCGRSVVRSRDYLVHSGERASCGCRRAAGNRYLAGWTLTDLRRMRAEGLSLNQIADAVAEHNGGARPERSTVSRWLGGSRHLLRGRVWCKAVKPKALAPKKARPLG